MHKLVLGFRIGMKVGSWIYVADEAVDLDWMGERVTAVFGLELGLIMDKRTK
jgi:hypothetical protein